VTSGLAWWGLPELWAQVCLQESIPCLERRGRLARGAEPERCWLPLQPQVAHGEHAWTIWQGGLDDSSWEFS